MAHLVGSEDEEHEHTVGQTGDQDPSQLTGIQPVRHRRIDRVPDRPARQTERHQGHQCEYRVPTT